jgi:hypothetical protein
MTSGVKCHSPTLLQLLHDESTLGLWGAVGNEVADLDVLQFWDDSVGARPVQRKQQLVDPARRLPAGAVPPHLHQPGPHAVRRCINCDGVIRHDPRKRHDVVTKKPHRALLAS